MVNNKSRFNKIARDIKSIKIQGANNVAREGFKAYNLMPTKASRNKLISLRSTEPMLFNILKIADNISYKQLNDKLKQNQEIINKEVFKLIKKDFVIFTHCHSSSVVKALIYAKKKGKKFEVYNTETRPLFQGRKTARELRRAGIKLTMFADSAASIALTREQETKKADLVLLGADAILKKGVINKVGSGMFAQIARLNKIPVFIVADSLKYFSEPIKIEQRNPEEIWNKEITKNFKIKNPAFEFIDKKYIKAIISELGTFSYSQFLKRVKKR